MADLEALINEFRTQFESGSDPDPTEFFARADASQRRELADRIDAYLDTAPTQGWDAEGYANSVASAAVEKVFESIEGEAGTWPELLPMLRKRARIARSDLVRRLAEGLGFGSDRDVGRVRSYYHRMEHGLIAARGVSDRVLTVLAGLVGTTPEALRSAGERVVSADLGGQTAFARMAMPDEDYAMDALAEAPAAAPGELEQRDALDELFLGRED